MTLDIIEAAAMKLCDSHLHRGWALASDEERTLYRELAGSIIVFVTPLIRVAALEEAAQVAENHAEWGKGMFENSRLHVNACDYIAATIRALKEQPGE